jgi:hypothetical protein
VEDCWEIYENGTEKYVIRFRLASIEFCSERKREPLLGNNRKRLRTTKRLSTSIYELHVLVGGKS